MHGIGPFGDDADFWTSDYEEEESCSASSGIAEERDENDNEAQHQTTEHNATIQAAEGSVDQVPTILHFEDVTFNNKFLPRSGDVPQCTLAPPRPNMIRKTWSFFDSSNVDNFEDMIPDMALKFPFSLDPFQKRAILHVHNREHTFVAAHTSAGKTVVAEYAIASAMRRRQRAIYTSPIKALSNQKFREFKDKFESVGIITGDITLNPDSQCLIVTTEILRSMIYRGDSILNQLDVVIFDEVHYVNDAERGVVWEEVIIMLPRDVCLVMLSATVPNYLEFADWIGRTKQREVFAVGTSKRPTPLKHFLWADDKEFLIMDQSKFRIAAFNDIYKNKRELQKSGGMGSTPGGHGSKSAPQKKGPQSQHKSYQNTNNATKKAGAGARMKTDTQRLQSLIRNLEKNDKLPVVVFCFSRRKCEAFPLAMGKIDLLYHQDERSKSHVFIKESFSLLSETDQELPQIVQVCSLLRRGIGVHHGGLLPIVKEAVEILFSKGLVKVLFATETFAMGVNMPARSVIFSSVEKHDGIRVRPLLASEYTQMAGRAGRRGLDSHGNVYILCRDDEPPDRKEISQMMEQRSGQLESRFRITFSMLLQLAATRAVKMEEMLSMSFQEYSRACRFPTLKRDKARLDKRLNELMSMDSLCGPQEKMEAYVNVSMEMRKIALPLHQSLWKHQYAVLSHDSGDDARSDAPFCVGRVIILHSFSVLQCAYPAVIVNVDSRGHQPLFSVIVITALDFLKEEEWRFVPACDKQKKQDRINVPDAIEVAKSGQLKNDETVKTRNHADAYRNYYYLRHIPLKCIEMTTSRVIRCEALYNLDGSRSATVDDVNCLMVAEELYFEHRAMENEWPPLSFSKHQRMVEMEFVETLLKQKDLIPKLNESLLYPPEMREQYAQVFQERRKCEAQLEEIHRLMSVTSLCLYDEMNLKKKVLQDRHYINGQGCITLKGQVAAALTGNDEITLTEALLGNIFRNITPSEAAALLSCFVFLEKVQDVPLGPTVAIMDGRAQIEAIHKEIQTQLLAAGVYIVHEDWWRMCNFGLSMVAYQWASGEKFSTIMESCDVQEGTIVRAILRLDELIRKIRTVTKTLLDDAELEELMDATSKSIHRDIIFTMSLYLK